MAEDRAARRARLRAGWTPPGPRAAGEQDRPALRPGFGETQDALVGDWMVFQLARGHRYSADDLLVAWFAGDVARRLGRPVARLLDLGAGIGSVGLMMAWQFPDARLVALEAQAVSAALARRSVAFNGVEDRVEVREADFRSTALTPTFDVVTASPPYYPPAEGRVSEAPQRGPCRFETRGGVEAYCAAAARALTPDGVLAVVMTADGRPRVEAGAAAAGLHVVDRLPVVFREGRAPFLELTALRRAASATVERPALILRAADGRRTEAFRALRLAMGFPPRAA